MFPYSLTLRAHAEAVRPCFLRKRPHGKDGYESHCWIRSIVLVFRIERMTGFEPAVSCLGSRRATTAPHPRCEGWDSNPRPPGYEPGELPSCSTPHGRAFFRIRRTAATCCPPAEKRMAGFRVNVRGLHAGWGLDTCVRQRSSTLLASGHGCVDSAVRHCRPYCLRPIPLRWNPWEAIFPCESD